MNIQIGVRDPITGRELTADADGFVRISAESLSNLLSSAFLNGRTSLGDDIRKLINHPGNYHTVWNGNQRALVDKEIASRSNGNDAEQTITMQRF
ncbi:MAG: hypothetical protein HQL74_07425 [Magnetococcales bacterium]|nr:hypothetical protein [Magnetococcales bacterium]